MSYPWKLEFSPDELSVPNASASRVDISDLVKQGSLRWKAGTDRLGEPAQAGEMSFTLLGRDFEPLYPDSPHYPNVVRKRRFFLSFDRGAGFEGEFVGYARTYQPAWPGNVTQAEVDVVCGDGFDILSSDRLPSLDPPEATSYADVIAFDQPWGYWRLGEEEGTKLVSHSRRRKRRRRETRRHYRRHGVRRWRTRETVAEVEGESGNSGVYKNTPTLGEGGALVGDADTCVRFTASELEGAQIAVDQSDGIDRNRLTIEAWVKLATTSNNRTIIGGPHSAAAGAPVFFLGQTSGGGQGVYIFGVELTDGEIAVVASEIEQDPGEWVHLVGTWDGVAARIYVNTVLDGEDYTQSGKVMRQGDAGEFLYLAREKFGLYYDGWLDEVAIYERVLPASRLQAHFFAAGNGFGEQMAGERIRDVATHVLWNVVGGIDPDGTFLVQPRMSFGQSPLEVIEEAMGAEGVQTLFGFDGDGDPYYLGWEWKGTAGYSTPQAVFGAPRGVGEHHFATEQLRYDDEVFNEAALSRDGGEEQAVIDQVSIDAYGRSAAEPITGLPNTSDADVQSIGSELLGLYAEPTWALDQLELHGSDEEELELIFSLGPGGLIRYKRRAVDESTGELGPAIDVVTHVLGYEKQLGPGDVVTCTFKLARGFNAAEGVWRMGITGLSEIGETTTLA